MVLKMKKIIARVFVVVALLFGGVGFMTDNCQVAQAYNYRARNCSQGQLQTVLNGIVYSRRWVVTNGSYGDRTFPFDALGVDDFQEIDRVDTETFDAMWSINTQRGVCRVIMFGADDGNIYIDRYDHDGNLVGQYAASK